MTESEAIETLIGIRRVSGYSKRREEALDMAIAALEKQEGKKPLPVSTRSTWVKCPVCGSTDIDEYCEKCGQRIDWSDEHGADIVKDIPAADVRPVSEIEKIIENLQEQADIYNARAKELFVEEDGQVSQYTWAVSLRETYRRIIKTLDDLIS